MGRSAGCVARTMILAACCALGNTPAAGQWRVDAQAGRLQYEAAPDVMSTTMSVALTRSTRYSSLGASLGIPFTEAEPIWGALSGYRRLTTSGASGVGVDLGANGFAFRVAAPDSATLPLLGDDGGPQTGAGAGAELMPIAFWNSRSGRMAAEARAGAVGFVSVGADPYERLAFVSDASISATPFADLTTRLDGRWVSVQEGGFPYAGVGVTWSHAAVVWASVGRWLDDAVDELSWEGGASLPLGDRFALSVIGRHEPIDPVYATPARTTWGAGVTLWLGETSRSIPEPVPAAYVDGVATITLLDDVAGVPSIAGDFNDWTPVPMMREGDAWLHRVALEPGVYNYAFVDEAGNWFVPEGTPGRHSDGMGGHVAVLVVSGD